MATVQTVIDRALRLLSQLPSGGSATSDETADALVALNDMLDSWRNEELMCWSYRTETLPMAASTSTYTMGPTGDLVTVRPVSIESAYITSGESSYPVLPLTEDQYSGIRTKASTANFPEFFLFRPTMPDATIVVYPVPTDTDNLKLVTKVPFTAFATAGDTITLPPGWQAALTFNLAVEIAPEYETEAKPSTVQRAIKSKGAIKRANHRGQVLETELVALISRGRSNILTGP